MSQSPQLSPKESLSTCAGKKLNDKGEVLDKDGNVIGKVEMIGSSNPLLRKKTPGGRSR